MGDFDGHPFRGNQYTTIAGAVAGRSGAVGPVSVKAYRTGKLQDAGRGIFFGGDPESIKPYQSLHGGAPIEEHRIEAVSAYVTQSQHTLHKELFGKSYNDAVYEADKRIAAQQKREGRFGAGDSVVANRKVEEKMARELRKRGHDALIYTSPPAPAKEELAALKPGVIKSAKAMKPETRRERTRREDPEAVPRWKAAAAARQGMSVADWEKGRAERVKKLMEHNKIGGSK